MLVVTYTSEAGGAARSLADFLAAFEPAPTLAAPPGALAEWARERGAAVVEVPERRLELRAGASARARAGLELLGHARDVRRLARELEPELVVAWGMRSALACAASLAGMPQRLVVRHGDLAPGPVLLAALRLACRRAELVLCASAAAAAELGRGVVVHPGVDLERFADGGGDPEGPVLVMGAITAVKRPALALEAFARAKLPGSRLRVVGEPLTAGDRDLLGQLRERASRPDLEGRVDFARATEDPAAELGSAACLLHACEREGFGRVVAEALACGLPVVAPAAGGAGEQVDRTCGRPFAPGDPDSAAEALDEALAEERAELARGARRRAEERADLAATQRRYRELLGSGGPQAAGGGLTLVTVLHDSEPELQTLLDSVEAHFPAVELVVVDSGSADSGGARLARAWGATVVELGENVGYGRAVNAGLERASRAVSVVANPDLELVDGSLAALAAEAARSPDRLLAPALLRPDGTRQDSVHPLPSSAPELVGALVPPAALLGPARLPADPWLARKPRRVGWAAGACLVARTELLRRLGPFSEDIFLYGEDLDLGLRAAEQGVETWFWPHARVLHHHGHATRRAGERFELLARQRRQVVERRLGDARRRRDDAAQFVTFGSRIAVKAALRRPADRERRQLAALRRVRSGG